MPKLLTPAILALGTFFAVPSVSPTIAAQSDSEFNTVMMDSTFQILGPSTTEPGKNTCGSGFLIGVPLKETPEQSSYTLVTAAHVYENIAGDVAQFAVRVKRGDQIVRTFLAVPIRKLGMPLYVKHPDADVAVMYVSLPSRNAHSMVNWTALATDELFAKLDIHPGDEMFTVGYPYCTQANAQGYPLLRRGVVASSINVPGTILTTFYLDLPAFGGNSGGPVYFVYTDRMIRGALDRGYAYRYIAGVLTHSISSVTGQPLGMAGVVPAKFIAEALKLLPPVDR